MKRFRHIYDTRVYLFYTQGSLYSVGIAVAYSYTSRVTYYLSTGVSVNSNVIFNGFIMSLLDASMYHMNGVHARFVSTVRCLLSEGAHVSKRCLLRAVYIPDIFKMLMYAVPTNNIINVAQIIALLCIQKQSTDILLVLSRTNSSSLERPFRHYVQEHPELTGLVHSFKTSKNTSFRNNKLLFV